MTYKIYISTAGDETSKDYVAIAKSTLWRLNAFVIAPLTHNDIPASALRGDALSTIQNIIAESNVFIGIYDQEYGQIPSGQTRSWPELEYQFAMQAGLICLIFMPKETRHQGDERMQAFKKQLEQTHVIHFFTDLADLGAQLITAVSNYRKTSKIMQLPPPAPQAFQPVLRSEKAPIPDSPAPLAKVETADDFEATVRQALDIVDEDIEAIVRRAIEVHYAQQAIQTKPTPVNDGILARPIFGTPLVGSQFQADIFMIMPFREQFDVVYQNIIKPTAAKLNLTIKRGDDFSSITGNIINEVWAAINACRLVIVETTEINANVYYELGIAHTLGKPAILLTQLKEVEEFPFDIRHLRFIVYENTIAGGEKLEADLKKAIIWILNDLEDNKR